MNKTLACLSMVLGLTLLLGAVIILEINAPGFNQSFSPKDSCFAEACNDLSDN